MMKEDKTYTVTIDCNEMADAASKVAKAAKALKKAIAELDVVQAKYTTECN